MQLEHDEIILLTRLLSNHLNGPDDGNPLMKLAYKLMEYADRTIEGGSWGLDPLPLIGSHDHPYGDRLMFQWKPEYKPLSRNPNE